MTEVPGEEPVIILLISGNLIQTSEKVIFGISSPVAWIRKFSVPVPTHSRPRCLLGAWYRSIGTLNGDDKVAFGTSRNGVMFILGRDLKQMTVSHRVSENGVTVLLLGGRLEGKFAGWTDRDVDWGVMLRIITSPVCRLFLFWGLTSLYLYSNSQDKRGISMSRRLRLGPSHPISFLYHTTLLPLCSLNILYKTRYSLWQFSRFTSSYPKNTKEMAAPNANQTPREEHSSPRDTSPQILIPTEQAETKAEGWPPCPLPIGKVIRYYDLPYYRNHSKNEKLMKHYHHMAQREARIQWIFKHTIEYQKMRDLDTELPRKNTIPFRFSSSLVSEFGWSVKDVDYEIFKQYRALIDVLVCVEEFDDSGQSDQFDEEHEWYERL